MLNQCFHHDSDNNEWHLHQDIVISLGLKRESDVWVCPQQGYVEVVRLQRDVDGKPILIEIKNQFLKDYLCARKCGLYVGSYYSRTKIVAEKPVFSRNEKNTSVVEGNNCWECSVSEIHEGSVMPFGEKAFSTHTSRTDIDKNEDVPSISPFPTDDATACYSFER